MGDNGKDLNQEKQPEPHPEPTKTLEQLASERFARYQAHPEQFVELSQIIVMAVRNPRSDLGLSVFVGNCKRSDLNNAESELNHIIRKLRLNMDIENEMKRQAAEHMIQKPGAMMNFARKIAGKR